jgi:type IX secretion system PorP/SprF family membrane protein
MLLGACIHSVQAQDLHFSQFHETPLVRNPALAGLFKGDYRIQGVYRNQWHSISFPYQTGSLNAEYKSALPNGDDYLTIGMQMLYDRAGTVALTSAQLLPAVNYHKSLSQERNTYLSVGMMGGIVSRRLDRSKVTTNSQFDGFDYNGSLPDGEMFNAGYNFFDASVGMSLYSTLGEEEQHQFFLGAALHHFTKPVNAFYRNINHLPKWVFSGGFKLNIGPVSYLTVQHDAMIQTPYRQQLSGALYTHQIGGEDGMEQTFSIGSMVRWGDAIIPMLKLDLKPLSIGFSYDATVGRLASIARGKGGFEISVAYTGYRNSDRSARNAVRCPGGF